MVFLASKNRELLPKQQNKDNYDYVKGTFLKFLKYFGESFFELDVFKKQT